MLSVNRVRLNKTDIDKLVEENSKSVKFVKPERKAKSSQSQMQPARFFLYRGPVFGQTQFDRTGSAGRPA